MWNYIVKILSCFRTSFSRKKAYGWFVTIILGFMTRLDKLGVSSVIRSMALRPESYESMMHFFRADSWSLDEVRRRWLEAVKGHAPTFQIFGRHILVGDGVEQPKEGHYMPGAKRMAQESGTQSKPELCMGKNRISVIMALPCPGDRGYTGNPVLSLWSAATPKASWLAQT